MNYKQIKKAFGGPTEVAAAVEATGEKLTKQAVSQWQALGRVPTKWQFKLSRIKPALKPDAIARREAAEMASYL